MARTKSELLERADELGLEADESMTNAELEAAIADAEAEDGGERDAGGEENLAPSDEQAADALGTDVGYIGGKVDPRPNEDYSLESGPESPSALEGTLAARESALEDLRASSE